MIKRAFLIATLLLLTACNDPLYPIQYAKAMELCAPNGGVEQINDNNRVRYREYTEHWVYCVCKNGASFKHTFKEVK